MRLATDCGAEADERAVSATGQPLGLLAFEVLDSASGLPLPARLTFFHADGRSARPTVGRFKNTLPSPPGRQTRAIPVGRYHVYVSRGPEYTLDRHEVDVMEGKTARLAATLSRVVDTGGFISSDYHLHLQQNLCDGMAVAAAEGLDLFTALHVDAPEIAVHLDGHVSELGLASFMATMAGMEVGTGFGHFSVFPMTSLDGNRDRNALLATRTPAHMLRLMRGGPDNVIAQINHPRHGPSNKGYFNGRLDLRSGEVLSEDFELAFDQTEVFNALTDGVRSVDSVRPGDLDWEGYIGRTREVDQNLKDWFRFLNRRVMIPGVGTTDVIVNREYESGPLPRHYPYLLPGYPRTYVHSEIDTPVELVSASIVDSLRRRASSSSCGPFVRFTADDGVPVGSVVTAADRPVTLHISVEAPPWIPVDRVEVVSNGAVLHDFAVGDRTTQVRFQKDVAVRPARDAWYLVIASSNRGWELPFERYRSFSFTNPIFVDVDGNGV